MIDGALLALALAALVMLTWLVHRLLAKIEYLRTALHIIAYGDQQSLEKYANERDGVDKPVQISESEIGDAMYAVRLLRYVAELTLAGRPVRGRKKG